LEHSIDPSRIVPMRALSVSGLYCFLAGLHLIQTRPINALSFCPNYT
jgi:hypothetical protein